MTISESLLPEFDQETTLSRKVLERCPEDKFHWAPHQKSMNLGRLATHLANLTRWGQMTLDADEFNYIPGEYKEEVPATTAALLDLFDSQSKGFREKLTATADEAFFKAWTMRSSGQVLFSMPKIAVLRGMVLNHAVHHRGQLSVYLRLLDIPIPSIYGPSADEHA